MNNSTHINQIIVYTLPAESARNSVGAGFGKGRHCSHRVAITTRFIHTCADFLTYKNTQTVEP